MWDESVGDWGPGLLEALREIEDPGKPQGMCDPLPVCAMLSGAGSLYAIAQRGREHPRFARSSGFSRERTPCAATLHHVFRRSDVGAFESVLGRRAQECPGEGEAAIAMDGRAPRGMHGGELPGVRPVAAYAGESGLVPGQRGVRGGRKESELGMAPDLPGRLELSGRAVTGDALYCRRELSPGVLEQGGDYFWALKDNRPGMKEAVSLLFGQPPWGGSFTHVCLYPCLPGGPAGRAAGKAAAVGVNSPERVPGLARTGTGLLRGTRPEAQGQGDGGAGLCHNQPGAGAGGRCPAAGNVAWAPGD